MNNLDQIKKVAVFMGFTFTPGVPNHICMKHDKHLSIFCTCSMKKDRFSESGASVDRIHQPEYFKYSSSFDSLMEVWRRLQPDLSLISAHAPEKENAFSATLLIERWKAACFYGIINNAFEVVVDAVDFFESIKQRT